MPRSKKMDSSPYISNAGTFINFNTWCYRNKLVCRNAKQSTHFKLDGGMFNVPYESNDTFLVAYERAIREGQVLYVVEKKSEPVFNLMAEFDMKLPDREVTEDEKFEIANIVAKTVAKLFPQTQAKCVISSTDPKNGKLQDGRTFVQSGLHFNWQIPVDRAIAMTIVRPAVVRELDAQMPIGEFFPLMELWNETYDPCVYQENGLRLMYSHKCKICNVCKRAPGLKSNCTGCGGTGHIDMGRPYKPLFILNYDAAGNECEEDVNILDLPLEILRYCSLRVQPGEKVAVCEHYDEALIAQFNLNEKTKAEKEIKSIGQALRHSEKKTTQDLTLLDPNGDVFADIKKFIAEKMPHSPIVKKIKTNNSTPSARTSFLANTNSHYCQNKGGEHGHSTVYFVLTVNGCQQHCFSQKTTGAVCCRDFKSETVPLPDDLKLKLFPRTTKKRALTEEESRTTLVNSIFSIPKNCFVKKLENGKYISLETPQKRSKTEDLVGHHMAEELKRVALSMGIKYRTGIINQ